MSQNEFLDVLEIQPEDASANFMSPDAPMIKRLQFWVDKLDNQLRTLYPEKLVATPRPTVHILNMAESNAFVLGSILCFDNVRFSPDGSIPTSFSPSEVHAFHKEGYISRSTEPCIHRQASLKELQTHLALITRGNESCTLTAIQQGSDNFIVSPNVSCQVDSTLSSMKSDSAQYDVNFAVFSTSNDFVIQTGLLQNFSEEEVLAVTFHELKHFYGAHASVGGKNYLYHIEQENKPTKPIASDDLKETNISLRKAEIQKANSESSIESLKTLMKPSLYSAIEGQTAHTYIAKALFSLALTYERAYCGNKASYDSQCSVCQKFGEQWKKSAKLYPNFDADAGLVGLINDDGKTDYVLLESAAITCLNTVALTNNPSADRLNELHLDIFISLIIPHLFFDISELDFPNHSGKTGDFLVTISEVVRKSGRFEFIEADYAQFLSLKPKFNEAKSKNQEALAQLQAFNEKADKEKLGYYSQEQEADESALESLAMLGLDPRVGIETEIKILPNPAEQACRAQFEKGWPGPIGWGPFTAGPHPAQCFRARNADKEITAHAYPKIAISPTSILKPSWSELLDDLNSRISGMQAISVGNQAITKAAVRAKLIRMNPCLYSKSRTK
ncbi:MAG: hypothetical protein M3Q07_23775 [Pseudobdellovibrionaceae bacterium]|nr:hypothetical protein [Pseudobdellovibrionaceae bacterium]